MNFKVIKYHINDIKDFIETWHYSHSVSGISWIYCFKLLNDNDLIGGAIFGKMADVNVWKNILNQKKILLN